MRANVGAVCTEGVSPICFPIWCNEWSVIRKLFHIRSALLISACQSENMALPGCLCSAEELLLFSSVHGYFIPPLSSKCITSCPKRGNMLWSCQSYEANEVSMPVRTTNWQAVLTLFYLQQWSICWGNDLRLFQFRKHKTIRSLSGIIKNNKMTSNVINDMGNSSYVLC